jgi:hypothetical protein
MKYLLPYELNNINQHQNYIPAYTRKQLGKKYDGVEYCEGRVYCYQKTIWYQTFSYYSFSTKEAAMKDMDRWFIENGWKLLTQEQTEKLLPLL